MLDSLHGLVEVTAEYAKFLEYGTVRMAARPYFWPAVQEHRDAFVMAMKQVGRL
jgi:HK97 gp10 family phage protein